MFWESVQQRGLRYPPGVGFRLIFAPVAIAAIAAIAIIAVISIIAVPAFPIDLDGTGK